MKPDNISLRDWFAGMAMQGLISKENAHCGFSDGESVQAYYIADKMMKEIIKNVKGR